MSASSGITTDYAAAGAVDATKIYGEGDTEVRALDGVTVDFARGRFTAIMGPSGSGKSTLMHCLAGLDTLTSGQVFIGDTDLASLDDGELTQLRRDKIGFVFQAFNLIPTLQRDREHHPPDGPRRPQARPGVARPASSTPSGCADRLHAPSERALRRPAAARRRGPGARQPARDHLRRRAHRQPRLPRRVPRSWRSCASAVPDLGQTIVMVTHDPVAAGYADRVLFLADGQIVDEMPEPTADRVLDRMKRFGRLMH